MQGSAVFVEKYLIPEEIKKRKSVFLGAYIADMILEYDQAKGTQEVPEGFEEVRDTLEQEAFL